MNKKLEKSNNFDALNAERVISKNHLAPGSKSCNAKLGTRDGYCQSPGVTAFNRCAVHGGVIGMKSVDLFRQAVGIEQAEKLQVLIEDTLNMDGELASGKTMLLRSLEQYQRASHVLEQFMEHPPERPLGDAEPGEVDSYAYAVQMHENLMSEARHMKNESFRDALNMIRTLTAGVHRNSRIKEGSKVQMDARQVASIIKVQLTVMAEHCRGCPKLKSVIDGIQAGTKDIPINLSPSNSTKKAMGLRAYGDLVNAVKENMPDDAEFSEG
jgi:hypothetical protein